MNRFKKYAENVFVAECPERHEAGEIIELTTKYGKTVEVEVFKEVKQANGLFYYSFLRLADKSYAERKAEQYTNNIDGLKAKSQKFHDKAVEGVKDLAGEPVKVGHHSEHRHRKLLERSWNTMGKSVECRDRADSLEHKKAYWEKKAKEINLSMPESLEYYQAKLEEAKEYHQGLKSGKYPKEHGYSMQYANKAVKDLERKVKLAKELWEV